MSVRTRGPARRRLPTVIAIAAAATLAAVAAACGPSSSPALTPSPAVPQDLGTRVTYEVWGADGTAAPAAVAEATRATLEARARALASASTVALGADGRLVLDVPREVAPAERRGLIARVSFAVVPLPPERFGTLEAPGTEVAMAGEPLPPGVQPLLTAADVDPSGVALGTDETGNRTITIMLRPAGAELLEAWSRAHIGEFLAVAVNGTMEAIPVLMTPLTDGALVISLVGDGWPTEADLPALRGDFPPGVRIVEASVERLPAP